MLLFKCLFGRKQGMHNTENHENNTHIFFFVVAIILKFKNDCCDVKLLKIDIVFTILSFKKENQQIFFDY